MRIVAAGASMARIMVAMSGGVDSSVSAALLLDQGHQAAGITMKTGRGKNAVPEARAVANSLGIPHYTIDAADWFEETVVNHFVDEYRRGRTPNPCIRCNRLVKFGLLLQKARELGYDGLATGHYANLHDGVLRRGADGKKDQSYFLYVLYHIESHAVHFPLGDLTKNETRAIAANFHLPSARKSESQDICFVPGGDYSGLIQNGKSEPGKIVDVAGNVLGNHAGIWRYTIGQRKGLGALGRRMFVKSIDVSTNTVVASEDGELFTNMVQIDECVFGPRTPAPGEQYLLQVRYRTPAAPATVTAITKRNVIMRSHSPLRAVAAGQAGVLYEADTVIGGGTIEKSWQQ